MESHEVLREVIKETSPKKISADLNVSMSLVYKWCEKPAEDQGATGANPLDRVDQLMRATGDTRIIHWLCHQAGGFFIRNPERREAHPEYLIPATNQIVREFADLLAAIAEASAGNQVGPKESEVIRRRWEDLKSDTETFVGLCEAGNFSGVHEAAKAVGTGRIASGSVGTSPKAGARAGVPPRA
jgi:hypothetical protein